jgi:glutathione S-transferase
MPMELYFSPLACSMATRISIYEAGIPAAFTQVDLRNKRIAEDGSDFLAVNPMGQVPALRTDEGTILTENPAVLQYAANRKPDSGLAPQNGIDRYRLEQWLCFTTSELHKVVFIPLLDSKATEGAKVYARSKVEPRLAYLNSELAERSYVLDRFTIADAYLTTVLNWSSFTSVDLAQWPAVESYFERMCERPSIARALEEETALWEAEQAARK